VAPIPLRCPKTEAALEGRPLDAATLSAAHAAIEGEIAPISDVRASAEYRTHVTGNVLEQLVSGL
jgi:xanthine dehydrogenase iron-sulfur cluster and FAD-binding subunit A